MLEISTTTLAPHKVFEASGHLEKFSDFMVKDIKNGQWFRADKLLVSHWEKKLKKRNLKSDKQIEYTDIIENADNYTCEELGQQMRKFKIKSPDTGNELSDPEPINLMFQTKIGPTGKSIGYLRPETAQGIFLNFKRLLEYNHSKLPFAAAQVGMAYRNEISPRSGLLRWREFMLAEIEHFYSQNWTIDHLKKPGVQWGLNLLDGNKVCNSLVGYYLIRSHQFLTSLGIPNSAIRFRQHQETEKAHYANDCWDLEVYTSHGWIEVVGVADRSNYDLSQHSKYSNADFSVHWSDSVDQKVIPSVVEPSFGIGRILHWVLEHNFWIRESDQKRTYFTFNPQISAYHIRVLPLLTNHKEIVQKSEELSSQLQNEFLILKNQGSKRPLELSIYTGEDSYSIGKRYSKMDEIGVNFWITVDHQTLVDNTVTVRDRDTTHQSRVGVEGVIDQMQAVWEV